MEGTPVETNTVDQEVNTTHHAIEGRGLVKRYGAITALDNVDFYLDQEEIVGLVGDNGAGKSTLIKVLSGVLRPEAGEILVNGKPIVLDNPKVAQGLGIETVYQDLALFEDLTIAANIYVGRELKRHRWFLDHDSMLKASQQVINRLRVDIPQSNTTVRTLSGGQRQAVALARSVTFGTKIIFLDEPTAALSRSAADRVLSLIRDLKNHGLSVIVISHNLEHVFDVADRIAVMRHGKIVGTIPREKADSKEIVHLMVGG